MNFITMHATKNVVFMIPDIVILCSFEGRGRGRLEEQMFWAVCPGEGIRFNSSGTGLWWRRDLKGTLEQNTSSSTYFFSFAGRCDWKNSWMKLRVFGIRKVIAVSSELAMLFGMWIREWRIRIVWGDGSTLFTSILWVGE